MGQRAASKSSESKSAASGGGDAKPTKGEPGGRLLRQKSELNERHRPAAELVRAAQSLLDDVDPIIERPRDPSFGDWATNVAMVLAKPLGKKPRALAAAIIERLDFARAGISAAEIAGPGFINVRVAADVFAEGLRALIAAGDHYGRSNAGNSCP